MVALVLSSAIYQREREDPPPGTGRDESDPTHIAHSLRLPFGDVPLFGQGKRREVYEDRQDLSTRPPFFLALPDVESGPDGSSKGLEYVLRPAQAGTPAAYPVARTTRDATS